MPSSKNYIDLDKEYFQNLQFFSFIALHSYGFEFQTHFIKYIVSKEFESFVNTPGHDHEKFIFNGCVTSLMRNFEGLETRLKLFFKFFFNCVCHGLTNLLWIQKYNLWLKKNLSVGKWNMFTTHILLQKSCHIEQN